MTIAHETTTLASGTGSWSFGLVSPFTNCRAAVVMIEQNATATDSITGVTYNGVAMTRALFQTESTEAGAVYCYYILNPTASGSVTIAVTATGTPAFTAYASQMSCDALKTIRVAGTGTGTSTSVANPSWTMSGLPTGVKLEAYEIIHSGLNSITATPATGWTYINNPDLGNQGVGEARQTVASSSSTLACGWIAATADDFVGISIAFYEDANLVDPESSSFEGGTVGQWAGNTILGSYSAATVANSSTRASVGTKSLVCTWATDTNGTAAAVDVTGLVNGQTYAFQADVYVPTGNPDVYVWSPFLGSATLMSVKDTWITVTGFLVADAGLHAFIGILGAGPTTAGQQAWIDNIRVTAAATAAMSASGSTAPSGSVAMTIPGGTPALAASGSTTPSGSVAITTKAAMSASATTTPSGAVAITRTTTLTASGQTTPSGAAALSVPLLMTASGATTPSGSAAITIAHVWALTASGSTTPTGSVAIATLVALAASGTTTPSGQATFTRLAVLTASGSTTPVGVVAITATRQLTASGSTTPTGAVALTMVALMSASGTTTPTGAVALSRVWFLAAAGSTNPTGAVAFFILTIPKVPAATIDSLGTAAAIEGQRAATITSPEPKAAFV